MDEVSHGLDEMALGSPDSRSNIVTPNHQGGLIGMEACGCAEIVRNDSVSSLPTPLHRCKGRHHLPIIGEEMQGDQLPLRKSDKKLASERELVGCVDPCQGLKPSDQHEHPSCGGQQECLQTTSDGRDSELESQLGAFSYQYSEECDQQSPCQQGERSPPEEGVAAPEEEQFPEKQRGEMTALDEERLAPLQPREPTTSESKGPQLQLSMHQGEPTLLKSKAPEQIVVSETASD